MKYSIIQYTFTGLYGSSVTINMTEKEYLNLKERASRSFKQKYPIKNLLLKIDNAKSLKGLEKIAIKYDICDVCKLKNLNLQGAKCLLCSVVKMLYKYPRLRAYTCFIGSHQQLKITLNSFKRKSKKMIKKFKIGNILNKKSAKKVARLVLNALNSLLAEKDTFIATTNYAFGLFDALLVDEQDYNKKRYNTLLKQIMYSEQTGHYPKNCNTPESVIYHEIGHLLDYAYRFSESLELKNYYKSLTKNEITRGLSSYAITSIEEFFAEAFCELESVSSPREIAYKVGQIISKKV